MDYSEYFWPEWSVLHLIDIEKGKQGMIEIVSIVSIRSLCLPIFSSGIVFPLTAAAALVIGAAMLLES